MADCWPDDDYDQGHCSCPMTNPVMVFLLHVMLVWFLMPGSWQSQFTGDPCWAYDWDEDWDE